MGTCSDGEPSVQSSAIPTPLAFCAPGKMTDLSRLSRYGTTFAPLTEDHGAALLTSYRAGFPVRTYQAPEREPELPANDRGYGDKWRESLARFDRATSSWKIPQCLLLGASEPSSVTWPRWGMMRDGVCWELTTSERPTSGTASGSWPTPRTADWKGAVSATDCTARRVRMGQANLSEAIVESLRMWPTPLASDGKKDPSGSLSRAVRPDLPFSFRTGQRDKVWSTPTAHNAKEKAYPAKYQRNTPTLAAQAGGSLNPTWVEWLMGWPLGWTDLKPLETGRCLQWRRLHGAS